MKIKSILTAVALMLCSIAVSAQTSVTSAIERYILANGQAESMNSQMRQTLVQLPSMTQMSIPSGYTAETMADKYLKERLTKDMAFALSPYISEQDVTEDEINELSDMLETPEGKLATQHSQILSSEEYMLDMMAIIQKDILSIVTTGKYQKTEAKCSAERRTLFDAYYQLNGVDKMIAPLLKAQLAGKVSDDILNKVENYMSESLPILMLNASEGVMTDDDLRFYKKLCDKPQYAKMIDGITKAISNPQQFGMAILTNYSVWVQSL